MQLYCPFVLVLFVFSCDQDKPTAQVESAPAYLDESLTTIEVNGAVFRRVAAKAVSTAQGGDMSIVLNYSIGRQQSHHCQRDHRWCAVFRYGL